MAPGDPGARSGAAVTNRVLVLRKLALMADAVTQARARRPDDLDVLRAEPMRRDALALSVLVAVQEAVDIAFHIATDEAWGVPASYAQGFEMLGRHGLIDADLARRLTRASGLRNRIAHAYATIDLERFWLELPEGLAALERFTDAVAAFVGAAPA